MEFQNTFSLLLWLVIIRTMKGKSHATVNMTQEPNIRPSDYLRIKCRFTHIVKKDNTGIIMETWSKWVNGLVQLPFDLFYVKTLQVQIEYNWNMQHQRKLGRIMLFLYLHKVVHYYCSICNIGLNKAEKGSAIHTQKLA